VRRGVLEIEIPDPAWARELVPLLPRIAARIARELPDRGVRKIRCIVAGEAIGRAAPIEPSIEEEATTEAPPAAVPPRKAPAREMDASVSVGDVLDVAASYLDAARRAGRRQ